MTRILACFLALFGTLAMAGASFAAEESEIDKEIAVLALRTDGVAAVAVVGPVASSACGFSVMGIDYATPTGRGIYASLLAARVASRRVDIVYERDGTSCAVSRINVR